MKTIVLGIGNLILSDDGVGIRVAQEIKGRNEALDVAEESGVGIAILDHIVGYDRLIIIDSIKTAGGVPGDVYKLQVSDLSSSMDLTPSHGMNIATTLLLGEGMGYDMPAVVRIYAIEIADNSTFQEGCTEEIERMIPAIAQEIIQEERLCTIHNLN